MPVDGFAYLILTLTWPLRSPDGPSGFIPDASNGDFFKCVPCSSTAQSCLGGGLSRFASFSGVATGKFKIQLERCHLLTVARLL